jgi:threonine dehydratase
METPTRTEAGNGQGGPQPGIVPITREAVVDAAQRIAPWVRRTPVLALEPDAFGLDCRLVLKLELHQVSGSFKARGTFNRLLAADVPEAGVVAASGGNFGLAVAHASERLGLRAEVFVPDSTPPAKLERLRAMSCEVVVEGDYYDDSLAASERRAAENGALFLHAFDDPEVVAGQGTCGLEFSQQRPELDTVIVAVGGAGLIGGIATWYGDAVRVIAVESERTNSLNAALAAGEPVEVEVGGLAADSLGAAKVGRYGFEAARRWVDDSVLLPDDAIRAAQELLWRETRIASEPAPAATLAALATGSYRPEPGERVGLVISGGNVNPADLP